MTRRLEKTHKIAVAQPDKAVPEIHGLALQDVDSDLLILRLTTCDDIRLIRTPTRQRTDLNVKILTNEEDLFDLL